MRALVIK